MSFWAIAPAVFLGAMGFMAGFAIGLIIEDFRSKRECLKQFKQRLRSQRDPGSVLWMQGVGWYDPADPFDRSRRPN